MREKIDDSYTNELLSDIIFHVIASHKFGPFPLDFCSQFIIIILLPWWAIFDIALSLSGLWYLFKCFLTEETWIWSLRFFRFLMNLNWISLIHFPAFGGYLGRNNNNTQRSEIYFIGWNWQLESSMILFLLLFDWFLWFDFLLSILFVNPRPHFLLFNHLHLHFWFILFAYLLLFLYLFLFQ